MRKLKKILDFRGSHVIKGINNLMFTQKVSYSSSLFLF